jgi:hypothetical protein
MSMMDPQHIYLNREVKRWIMTDQKNIELWETKQDQSKPWKVNILF